MDERYDKYAKQIQWQTDQPKSHAKGDKIRIK